MKSIEAIRASAFYIPMYIENGLPHFCWTEKGKLKESIILSEAIKSIYLNGSFLPDFKETDSLIEYKVSKVKEKFSSLDKRIFFGKIERTIIKEYSYEQYDSIKPSFEGNQKGD